MNFEKLYDDVALDNEYTLHIIFDEILDPYLPDGSIPYSANKQVNIYFTKIADYKIILSDILKHGGKFVLCNSLDSFLCDGDTFTQINDDLAYVIDLSFDKTNLMNSKKFTLEQVIDDHYNEHLLAFLHPDMNIDNNFKSKLSTNDIVLNNTLYNFINELRIMADLKMKFRFTCQTLGIGKAKCYFLNDDGFVYESYKSTPESIPIDKTRHHNHDPELIKKFNLMRMI